MEYCGIAMGGKIYSLRSAKGLTQEQLAEVLCISPAAVSKWERNLATPGLEMLCALADFFDCTIDELAGRTDRKLEQMGCYDRERLRMAETAKELLALSELSRQKGLLALEDKIAEYKGESRFLPFAVNFFIRSLCRQLEPARIAGWLEHYAETLPEQERMEGHMITHLLGMIVSGEQAELLREEAASYIGIGYREKLDGGRDFVRTGLSREELIESCRAKPLFSDRTSLLEELTSLGDFEIQVILRNLDNATLTAALCGASGGVLVRFLSNLSDRLLPFICEDMDSWQGTEEEILKAQRRILELSSRAAQE